MWLSGMQRPDHNTNRFRNDKIKGVLKEAGLIAMVHNLAKMGKN